MTFIDKAGKHKDKAGNDCTSLAFEVTGRGCGGIYTDTVSCFECGQEFEAIEKKLRNKHDLLSRFGARRSRGEVPSSGIIPPAMT